jgi:regulator of sirC expression with transglutaminase-like and TPR domain
MRGGLDGDASGRATLTAGMVAMAELSGSDARANRRDLLRRLAAVCEDREIGLDVIEAGLILSMLRRPTLQAEPYRAHIATLCGEVGALRQRRRPPADALRDVLTRGYGYRGDRETYDDLRNADLAAVIDRRRGLPVALSLVWLFTARAQGWSCVGLAFPGHFLVFLEGEGMQAVLDPFNDGAALQPPDLDRLLKIMQGEDVELQRDHVATIADRDVLVRLENNIKIRQLRDGDDAGAASTLEHMTTIAPDRPDLWFEAGTLNARLEAVGAACRAFDRFLEIEARSPPSIDPAATAARTRARHDATALLRDLRRRLN